jgi:Protein kinase domain
MIRPARMALLLGSAAVLGGVALVNAGIVGRTRDAAQAEALRLAAHAAALGQLELQTRIRQLEARATAAASLNAVRALVAQRVDERTLRDGFETEEWWRSFRDEFPAQLLILGPERYEFGKKELAGALKVDPLVREVVKHSPASALLRVDDLALSTSAALVDVPVDPARRPAAIVLAQPLSTQDLARIAGRTGGAVAVAAADRRVLAESGPPEEQQRLRELLGRPRAVLDGATAAAGSVPIGDGLSLWTYADTRLASEAARRPAQTVVAVLWVLGLAASAALLVASFRRPREDRALLEATRDELRRTRAELDRLRTPVPATHAGEVPLGPTLFSNPTPTRFGRYQLLHVLGQGGMATVYLAVSHGVEGFRRFFVVKRLREDAARMPQVVHQFVIEARLGASLVHSNIVPIFDFGRVGDEFFLAQEYILGRDLNLLVRRARHQGSPGLPLHAVLHVAHEILDALSYAHSRTDPSGRPLGIVHRDISPMNVMVSRQGEVKLLDFGIARFDHRDAATDAGLVKGNVLFMSPEQARGLPIDARSDLFSLGLTLYYCLTGEPLYQQDGSDYDLLVRAAQGPGPLELARVSSLPGPAAVLLERALRIDPNGRFESAEQFLLALPANDLAGGAPMLLELVERLVGTELASEEARFAALAQAGEETSGPASERTTEPGKTAVQFALPPSEIHR